MWNKIILLMSLLLVFTGCTTKEENTKEKEIDVKIEMAKKNNVSTDQIEIKSIKEEKAPPTIFDEYLIVYEVKVNEKQYIVEYDQRDKFTVTEIGGK